MLPQCKEIATARLEMRHPAQRVAGEPTLPLTPPFRARPAEDRPKRHGFFRVHPVLPNARDRRYPHAILLDYGLGRNGLSPTALLRDYVVQVYEGDPTLLLGYADIAIGGLRIPAGFFVLKRQNRHQFTA